MGEALRIENLNYSNILKDVSIFLEEKTFNVLVGQNGSGKTTLVKSILGLTERSGTILVLGSEMNKNNKSELLKNIGVVMENTFLLDGTALYNIMYPLLNLNYEEMEAKKEAYSISKKLDIDSILLNDTKDLSISEKKLVSFATAVVHNPSLIIIDDSFDELDNYYRSKVIDYLKSQKNSTILFITNNEEDILLADNLIIMNDGQVIKYGSMNELIKDENIFIKNNIKLPFLVDLSHKLKSYELIDDVILDIDRMVDEVWK